MSGPWEDYKTESGPWEDYQSPATQGPELRQGEPPDLWDKITGLFKDPGKEGARAVKAIVDAESLKISPSAAYAIPEKTMKKAFDTDPELQGRRKRTLEAIKKFNDTGVEDGWHESLFKSLKTVPLQAQIAAGGLLQMMGEGTQGQTFDPYPAYGLTLQDTMKFAAEKVDSTETLKLGRDLIASGKEKSAALAPNVAPGSMKAHVNSAVESVGLNVAYLLPSLATGNPGFALALMGATATGQAYGEQREGGSGPWTATLASLGYGASEVLTEFVPVGVYLKPGKQFVNRLVEAEFSEIPTESLNTIIQDTIDKVTIHPDMTLRDAMDHVEETIIVTAISTLGLAGASHTVNKAIAGELTGGAREIFTRAKNAALRADKPPKQAVIEGLNAVAETEEGKAIIEQKQAAIVQEAGVINDEAAEPSPIDEQSLDDALDQVFSGERNIEDIIIEDTLMEGGEETDIQQGETAQVDFPEVSADPVKTVIDSVRAVNQSLGERGEVDLAPLVEIGKVIWNEGRTKIEDFTSRMKEYLGDAWEKVKDFVKAAYDKIREERGSISFVESSRSQKQDKTAKSRIRELTGQTTSVVDMVRQDKALAAGFKQAERYSRIAFKEGVKSGVEKANQVKPETTKQRIRRITGQTDISRMVSEDEALRAAFKKAEQAGRVAYREGNKEGVAKAKTEMKALIEKARAKSAQVQQTNKDIKTIKKLSKSTKGIDVEFQKRIRDLVKGLDFTKLSEKKYEELQELQKLVEESGSTFGIPEQRIKQLSRLTKTPIRDMTPENIAELRSQIEQLAELGKMLAEMKYQFKEDARLKKLDEVVRTTNNLDPHVDKKMDRTRDKMKIAVIEFYTNTLHTPRVAELADKFIEDGPQLGMIKRMGEAETELMATAINREIKLLEKLKELGITEIIDDSDSAVRMMAVMKYREGATDQAERLLDMHGMNTLPTLTEQEEAIIEAIRQDMEDHKAGLIAVYEALENDVFPELPVYYLPNKYVGEEEIIPELQTEGKGRTVRTFDGFTHKRVPGVDRVLRTDILEVYREAILEQEWYKGMQPVIADIKSVVLTDEYKEAAGSVLYNWWKDQIDITARRGWSAMAHNTGWSNALRRIRHNLNTAILGFKASTIILQPFAVFDGMAYVNNKLGARAAGRVLSEFAKSWLVPGKSKSIIEESNALKQRKGGELAITEELLKAKGESLKDKATRLAFKWIQTADIKTAAAVQEAVRKIMVEEGMSEQDALKEAEFVMKLSQGDSSITSRPHILGKGEGVRTIFTFQTFVMNRWGIIMNDLILGKIGYGNAKEKFTALASLGILMLAGAEEDEAREWLYEMTSGKEMKKDNRSLLEKTFVNLASTMPAVGSAVNAVSTGMGAEPPAIRIGLKGLKGVRNMFHAADGEKRFKGFLDAVESGTALFIGLPGTAQFFDILEGGLE